MMTTTTKGKASATTTTPPSLTIDTKNHPTTSDLSRNDDPNNKMELSMTMICVAGPYMVLSPPIKKQMVSGHLLPTIRSATAISMIQQPKRQISIVVYRSSSSSSSSLLATAINELHDDDRVMVRVCRLSSDILPPTTTASSSPVNSNITPTSSSNSPIQGTAAAASDTASVASVGGNDDVNNQWIEHKLYRLDEIQIIKQRKDSIEVQLGLGNETIVRDYKFHDHHSKAVVGDPPMMHFCNMLQAMKQLEKERAQKQMQVYKHQLTTNIISDGKAGTNTDGKGDGKEGTTTAATVATAVVGSISPNLPSGTDGPQYRKDRIQILVEIVSATNLPISDLTSTDAYIIVRLGSKEIHRTATINNNLSPIYTLYTGSLFVIDYTIEEFFYATTGLLFTIKDYDQIGNNDLLGTVHLSLQQLLQGTGERMSYPISLINSGATNDDIRETTTTTTTTTLNSNNTTTTGTQPTATNKKKEKNKEKKKKKVPMLNLRYKRATQHDVDFIHQYQVLLKNKKSKLNTIVTAGLGTNSNSSNSTDIYGIYASETVLPVRLQPLSNNLLHRTEKKHPTTKEPMYRVRPCPDPERPTTETEWMTKKEIHMESMKPSTYWIEAGNGNIGTLYLEMIGCDELPNMDVGNVTMKTFKEKTDAFACIVFEDVIVHTDVISNTLSPRWMPWCHRAFALNILHPSSDVFIGIFDHDNESNPLHMVSQAASFLHDPIGRIVLNLSHFKPNTLYTLQYPLYFGELKEHRKKTNGTVTLRIRLDYPDIRKAMLGGVTPPPASTVSVSRRTDFDVAHYTTDGIVDDREFSLDTLTRYIEELQTYQSIIEYIQDAFIVVWLWRGHYPVTVGSKTYKLPIHSMTAYTWAILVTWNWNRLPAFWAFCIAWILLATNEYQSQHPSRWHNCPTYYALLERFIRNETRSEMVHSNTNIDAINAYNEQLEKKRKRLEEEKKEEAAHEAELQKELGQEIEAAEAAEEVGKKRSGLLTHIIPDNPLKGVLFPIQKQAREIVFGIRIVKTVIVWKEAYYAFWVTTVALAVSAVAFWIPWSFILRWIFRIVAIVALGPWMAIVDRKYFQTDPNLSDEERDELLRQKLRSRYEEVLQSATNYFQRKERAMKLATMKKYMFGQYPIRVPQFCEDLFDDIPLPSSSCVPYDASAHKPIEIKTVIYGQTLRGDMIPVRESEIASNNKKSPTLTTTKTSTVTSVPPVTEKKDTRKHLPFFGMNKKRVEESTPLLKNEGESVKVKASYESVKKSS